MAVYLMDYENTKSFQGIEKLSNNDSIVVFYSNNATNIAIDDINKIINKNVHIEFKKVETGSKNALDFQLSSYLGYVIGLKSNKSEPIYIVSNDKGYETLIAFWKNESNVEIRTVINFGGQSIKVEQENNNNCLKNIIQNAKLELSNEDVTKAINIINTFKTKTAINNNLNKLLKDSDKVGKLMKVIKNHIKDKK